MPVDVASPVAGASSETATAQVPMTAIESPDGWEGRVSLFGDAEG